MQELVILEICCREDTMECHTGAADSVVVVVVVVIVVI